MKKKYIFSDIDGTLYGMNKKIDKNYSITINKTIEIGHEIIFCTGNPYFGSMKSIVKKHPNLNYMITSNGAVITNVNNNETLFSSFMDKNYVKELILIFDKYELNYSFWNDKELFCSENEKYKKFVTNFFEEKLSFYSNQQVIKFLVSVRDKNLLFIEKLTNELNEFGLSIANLYNDGIEVMNPNINKAFALKVFKDKIENYDDDYMFIGDSNNDVQALKVTEFSYAMANGMDEAKKISNFHTSRFDQNGWSEAIEDYLYRVENKYGKKEFK
ncbi:MAG: Cof-type HAD-IIB family hydrolase [Mollicutes bacterium PWAP]|nr:Cof-type HAD-IIB family hydrolase [Mollicutes bacterium PWAP]